MMPEVIVLEHLKDLPTGAGTIQTSAIHTPEEAQAWAAGFKAEKVYYFVHSAGWKSAFIVMEEDNSARRRKP
jgi:hypothetical protein